MKVNIIREYFKPKSKLAFCKVFFSIQILVTISKDPFHAFSTNDDIFRDQMTKKHKSSISEDPFRDLMTKTKLSHLVMNF